MNPLPLAMASIKSRPVASALCMLSAAAGVAMLTALFLLSQAIESGFLRNAGGIDVVVGAKGSPLQLVLSSVYHADVPTGNIDVSDMERITHDPKVRAVIPLALGDNFGGFRIVGTTPEYIRHYDASFAEGRAFDAPFEAVGGALTGLSLGQEFSGAHGFSADSDDIHHFHAYKIVGLLKPTGTVLDRLILTAVGSVQELHKHPDLGDPDAAEEMEIGHQVTALLVKVKSPIGAISLPRDINRQDGRLLAANPAYEMARLSRMMGLGRNFLVAVGIGFFALAQLMLFSSLASGLAARRYDLGIMRVMGASREKIFATVIAEGMALSGTGSLAGLLAGHLAAGCFAHWMPDLGGIAQTAALLTPQPLDAVMLIACLSSGFLAGLLPAMMAARADISELLTRGRL